MKIVRFTPGADIEPSYGLLEGATVARVETEVFGPDQPVVGRRYDLEEVRLLAPVEPPNVLCLGKNFRAYAGEENPKFPKSPLLFIKATTSVVGPGAAIVLPEIAPAEVYYEAELAVVIGRTARNVSESDARQFVLGYTVANDVGARDCQAHDGQWARAKSFDTFCPLGPWIETDLEPGNCRVTSRVNGTTVQDSSTALMIFDVAYTVSFLSHCMTLLPGTVVCMGSPGVLAEPRPLLRPGDSVEVEVTGLGVLRNPVQKPED
jgi:2-keto-4-pentenoate hydratase/2-oxohepta-3-ene-1,7-dioic acid hydratase in catechol pathway